MTNYYHYKLLLIILIESSSYQIFYENLIHDYMGFLNQMVSQQTEAQSE